MTSTGRDGRLLGWFRASWRAQLSTAKWVCMAVFVIGLLVGVVGVWIMHRLTWFGDMVALILPMIFVVMLLAIVVCLVRGSAWPVVAALASLVIVIAVVIVLPRLPDRTGPPTRSIVLVATNMLHDNSRMAEGVASALAQHPDVLVVSELTQDADRLFSMDFPYRLVTDRPLLHENYAEGVYSKYPLDTLTAPTGLDDQILKVRVNGPQPFILYAVHLPRPVLSDRHQEHTATFAQHRDDALRLDQLAKAETEPVVIAGDLNLSDRTSGYAALHAGRHDAVRTRWAGTTYVGGIQWELFALRIDHIFVPGNWCAKDGGNFLIDGSDHNGVRSVIGPCA
ncbi:MAG: hypothetical protein JWM34_999 [Ilumatobacteraceae bacterium]|nr:hypothetical protein [Ilumatobacteraceae bacterium]